YARRQPSASHLAAGRAGAGLAGVAAPELDESCVGSPASIDLRGEDSLYLQFAMEERTVGRFSAAAQQEGGHLLPGALPTRVGYEGTAPAGGH
ncbi:hypothetical protein THAOC_27664, partial [Thalassiosira oceanica]